jgi:hypothetical protein
VTSGRPPSSPASRGASPDPSGAALTGPLRWAVWLLFVEAVGGGLVGLLLLYQGIAGEAADQGNAFALAGFVAVVAAILAGLGLALARRKPRARAPAIVLQLLSVMIGLALLTSGGGLVGIPIAVLGVVVATLLLTPSTHTALGVRSPSGER